MSVKANPGDKVVLAYSGGLDTSIILKWLVNKGFQVVCYCANVGQFGENFEKVQAKAMALGAAKVYIEDLRKEFVVDYLWPAVQANAIYESRYLLGTSLARPVIAKKMVEIAEKEGCKYVAHGATGKGNDQVRFELCAQALNASLKTIAPWRDPEFIEAFKGRQDLLAYAKAHNIPVDATPKAPYSVDENLYHTSYESGMLEDPMTGPLPEMFKMTVDPKVAPDAAEKIRITFENGVPVKVANLTTPSSPVLTDPLELFLELNRLGGKHGVGRIDIVENRFVGIKSRGVYETPGGTILRDAHLDLEGLCMDREVMKLRDALSVKFAEFCYNGFWFAPEMDFVRHAIAFSQKAIAGHVDVELYKGNVTITGRYSDVALYSADLASMDMEGGGANIEYNPSDAQGFIRINATRLKAYNCIQKKSA
ncbi:argininosuccinate synthase [Saprolegnia parasitica CBS 223.65]|uniref:Argininosuccinate synthase n=1 Tax=Saprolegnia parasitica (strain CBS 223.65) TaxID=695850 RepID=A0A067D2C0_SAPPC|nr:argininosuccinate synthase [Saprolegnia parasitica CBS 223.65]KDO32901.1 argininosuccinate synthase [Saprolegnia parasitica CBS 223.65]|eukprot:XP_012196551.1 argininosuccinate synthase [Saprolegnia parasitica CBS 223.65]